jgi:hypothetical protein
MESIDALALAVNAFDGGLVLVSHDMRLISQVAKEIWICDNKRITKYKGDIQSFKLDMRDQMGIDGQQNGQLRGDASVMKTNNKEVRKGKTKKAPATKATTAPAPTPAPKPVAPVPVPTKSSDDVWGSDDEDDMNGGGDVWGSDNEDKNSKTAFGTSSMQSALPSVPAPVPKPAANVRYVPPHLRNRS